MGSGFSKSSSKIVVVLSSVSNGGGDRSAPSTGIAKAEGL